MSLAHRAKLSPDNQVLYDKLTGSLLKFTQTFFKLRTNREFKISNPSGRESHFKTISRALTKTQRGECRRLIINVPPRYGKTELCIHYVAWCMARYPDSKFMYVSYNLKTAAKQTHTIRQIMQMPAYRDLFGVELSKDTTAKDHFTTTQLGEVYAIGAGGGITGHGGGILGAKRFGGAIIIDDINKAIDVTYETIRENTKDWYLGTLDSRYNDHRTPGIFIGQRLHEDDLAANLIVGYDGNDWDKVILPALGGSGNALYDEKHTKEQLLKMEEVSPYHFASQMQQNPQPAGGGIFSPDWFVLTDFDPKMLTTFITVDTAETSKSYNDATVFSFMGLYRIVDDDIETDLYGLHWIDCLETRVEPKDLRSEFLQFYAGCMRYGVKPELSAIEKKSTGTTLNSVLKDVRGMNVLEIERKAVDGGRYAVNKTTRFLRCQPYVAQKLISLPKIGRHTEMCIEHMRKITANDTHRHDDIADTLADAIEIALIDKIVGREYTDDSTSVSPLSTMSRSNARARRARVTSWR